MNDMNISKASLTMDGSSIRFSLPISKIDVERRIISGFATTDAVDKQSDIVTTDASIKAFAKFRGNIREMHQPTAVGKMISFKEDKYFDPESRKFYAGVYVSAYISKGAQDTWEKVLDGTLSGFSIGGRMNKWDDAYDETADKKIRIIKDYDLVELSLVDNPANQFANILSIEKVDGVDVLKSDIPETVLENVFYDKESGLVLLSENESETSPVSGAQLENIGFVEKNDNEKTEMIKFLVDSAKGINTSKMTKEASPMNESTQENAEDIVEKSEDVVEETQVAPEADAEVEKSDEVIVEATEETVEKSEDVAEISESDLQDEVSKSDEVVEAVAEIKNTLTSAFSDLAATVKSLHEQVEALNKSLGVVSNEVKTVADEVKSAKQEFDEFGKRVDAVEADTAFRKSGDLGEIVQDQPEKVEKSLWGGRFLKTADLFI
jgi:outer membrane murein-binding lipoprotein Lpp